ncbi:MAG: protein-L-isoaspartate O-methyltransferase [Xanthomonadales bacterium]|nr:protein-L-isoaspartate O-methyltransferase [Xanthomonadales bacterium]ODU93223.1 MAG: protein-L-isoaspartate O-methyltransferase [Rhodanobacter sp. SCN 66-43]OJY82127.1 MAG: protein-L-isoaspartate O-methyltransferase [Xanthomonadales bacterium 66-474]
MNTHSDFATARQNMVENQVRPWEVLDARVLDVLATLPREHFVPAAYRAVAYADIALPIGHGEVMLKPVVEGRFLQALLPASGERVLEIGTGTGYFAACLAKLGGHVTSIDHRAEFVDAARARLQALAIDNVECLRADALSGFAPTERFDAIAVTGAVATVPGRFVEWLKPAGRMVLVRGVEPAMQAVLLQRASDGGWIEDRLFETDVPYLAGAEPAPRFHL